MSKEISQALHIRWGGSFSIVFILARSTSIYFSKIQCPRTISSYTMNCHLSQINSNLASSHHYKTRFKLNKYASKEEPKTEKSFINTLMNLSTMSWNIVNHILLKSGWCITKPKRHLPIRKSIIWVSKSSFLLVFWG